MKDIQIDGNGEMRCWNCCNKNCFTGKRSFRAKAIGVTAGVATLGVAGAVAPSVTKKKLKCQLCSECSDIGSAKSFTGLASKKWQKIHEKNGLCEMRSWYEKRGAEHPTVGVELEQARLLHTQTA